MLKFVVLAVALALCSAQDASAPGGGASDVASSGNKPPGAGPDGSGAPGPLGFGPPGFMGGPPPTPDPKQCKVEYLKDAKKCGKIPEIMDEAMFEKCKPKHGPMDFKGPKGFGGPMGFGKMRKGPGGSASDEEGNAEGAAAPAQFRKGGKRGGKRQPQGEQETQQQRAKRSPKRPSGPPAGFRGPPGGKGPGCFNCMLECVFNNSGLLDSSNSVNIAAVKAQFKSKLEAGSAWEGIIDKSVDECWADTQAAPAPTTPAPPPDMPVPPFPKKECKHHPTYLMQCVTRRLVLETPESEKVDLAGDCAARREHLKGCDPMMPGWMDFGKMMKDKMKGRMSKNSKVKSSKAKKAKLRKSKKATTQA